MSPIPRTRGCGLAPPHRLVLARAYSAAILLLLPLRARPPSLSHPPHHALVPNPNSQARIARPPSLGLTALLVPSWTWARHSAQGVQARRSSRAAARRGRGRRVPGSGDTQAAQGARAAWRQGVVGSGCMQMALAPESAGRRQRRAAGMADSAREVAATGRCGGPPLAGNTWLCRPPLPMPMQRCCRAALCLSTAGCQLDAIMPVRCSMMCPNEDNINMHGHPQPRRASLVLVRIITPAVIGISSKCHSYMCLVLNLK
ncbi:hypothetical protein BRADI_3g15115v3 [Brachypodium distachyon]|uniref:Uncharacterized protein n=1 Tax=Brachypodium distachyon TaxID=15368 RepID=A0A2K2CX84_BRADI|nr:hypothetical protein BRADI_3g15115v3 [Brachypodium distachyon]